MEHAITHLAREESGRILALLAARVGDLSLADDAVQEALIEAAETWPQRGIPANPAAWLHAVARNKAIDLVRREASSRRRMLAAAPDLIDAQPDPLAPDDSGTMHLLDPEANPLMPGDEQLRLILLCCHPALDRDTQVALTLRLVGGLTTGEIAAALLLSESTLAQRIVRAKRKIRDARIPLSIPHDLGERIDALLGVLYLIFNEGYLARGDANPLRTDLCAEAIRLTTHAANLLPASAETKGLLALELYHHARAGTRLDAGGDLVMLEDQDRALWDSALIDRANRVLHTATLQMTPGPYQVQAMIAGCHANAHTASDTDWTAIATCYATLGRMTSSPVVALNHAVAVAMAEGPQAGVALLDGIDGLETYHLFHAARGELLARSGDTDAAKEALLRAYALTQNTAERRHLDRRLASLDSAP
ncbi:MAG: sigma-70 family RNA polymerase sigma factor [Thermomicrobiales bacterium]